MEKVVKKTFYTLMVLLLFYLFILSVTLIKDSLTKTSDYINYIRRTKDLNINEINAFGFGWLLTIIMQSSGAATSTLASLSYAGVINTTLLIFMVLGTRIGTTITPLLFSLLFSAKRRDFRHGFEIGIANLVYAFPIAIFMFLLEHFFSFFSKISMEFTKIWWFPDILGGITSPSIKIISKIFPSGLMIILGILLLIISLRQIAPFLLKLWGRDYLEKKIKKFTEKKRNSFLTGFFIALLLTSTSITLTLLLPFIVSRLVNLKKVIPYIIGTNLGGVVDAILSGIVIGEKAIPAILTYVLFSVIGVAWLFNPDLMFKITKFISKRTLHISKKRAIIFIILYILTAVVLSFL